MRQLPKPFERYRHFKGNVYQILTLAVNSEDGRDMVVYQALYGDYKVYVRPLDLFMSLTDTEKYPDVKQRYRFEKVEEEPVQEPVRETAPKQEEARVSAPAPAPERIVVRPEPAVPRKAEKTEAEEALDPGVLAYLDADSVTERLNILVSLHGRITDDMINTLALATDVEVEKGSVEDRYNSLKNCLLMKEKFEKIRLR